jgi:hypothetical protein
MKKFMLFSRFSLSKLDPFQYIVIRGSVVRGSAIRGSVIQRWVVRGSVGG